MDRGLVRMREDEKDEGRPTTSVDNTHTAFYLLNPPSPLHPTKPQAYPTPRGVAPLPVALPWFFKSIWHGETYPPAASTFRWFKKKRNGYSSDQEHGGHAVN